MNNIEPIPEPMLREFAIAILEAMDREDKAGLQRADMQNEKTSYEQPKSA